MDVTLLRSEVNASKQINTLVTIKLWLTSMISTTLVVVFRKNCVKSNDLKRYSTITWRFFYILIAFLLL